MPVPPRRRRGPRANPLDALRGKPELQTLADKLAAKGAFDRLEGTYARKEIRDVHAAILKQHGYDVTKSSMRNQSLSVKYVADEIDKHDDPDFVHAIGGRGAVRYNYPAIYMVGLARRDYTER